MFDDAVLLESGSFDVGSFDVGSFDAGSFDAGSFDAGLFDAGLFVLLLDVPLSDAWSLGMMLFIVALFDTAEISAFTQSFNCCSGEATLRLCNGPISLGSGGDKFNLKFSVPTEKSDRTSLTVVVSFDGTLPAARTSVFKQRVIRWVFDFT